MRSKIILVLAALVLVGCAPPDQAPQPDSDSPQAYGHFDGGIEVDDNVYVVRGTIVGDLESLTQPRAEGTISGGMYGSFGSVSGRYSMWQEGKGFVRIEVVGIQPDLEYVISGMTIIIKTTDQKVMALLPGDQVVFKCRSQYEAVAAVRHQETFNLEKVETWELDYCRLATPKIGQ